MTRQQWLAQWFPSDDRTESNDSGLNLETEMAGGDVIFIAC